MTLNKRYIRNIKQNRSFYICMSFLTMLAVMLNIILNGALVEEKKYLDDFFEKTKVEDGQFNTYKEIGQDDISSLEDTYDVILEKQSYADYEVSDKKTVRIFRENEKLNLYEIAEGEDLAGDDDILLSLNFAATGNYALGDTFEVYDKEYTIKGYFVKPDYLTTFENLTDNFAEPSKFGIAVVSRDAFDRITSDEVNNYYSVVYQNKEQEADFRNTVYEDYMTFRYMGADSNSRITTAKDTVERMDKVAVAVLPFMLILVILLTGVILARRVKADEKQIGILTALGYKKGALSFHYSIFGVIPGVIGSILGIVLGATVLPKAGGK